MVVSDLVFFCYGKYNPMNETTWWSWNSILQKKKINKHGKRKHQGFFFKGIITVQNFGRSDNVYPRDRYIVLGCLCTQYLCFPEVLIMHPVIILFMYTYMYAHTYMYTYLCICLFVYLFIHSFTQLFNWLVFILHH